MSGGAGWRSTTLGLAERHCPRALDFYEARAPYDRSVFAVGVAAHAVLEDLGHAAAARGEMLFGSAAEEVARATCERLISHGRDFEGDPEPPLPSAAVWAGRDLAILYHGERPANPHFHYEEGVAVSRDWKLCPYGPGAWLRARIDARGTRMPSWAEEDETGGPRLVIDDYKSAWTADESELYTLQRKIQAVLGWLAWGAGHDSMEIRVINFRARKIHSLEIFPHEPEGAALLAQWRRDVESEVKAREVQVGPDGKRPAAPGPQCAGCPYFAQCESAQAFVDAVWGGASREELAKIWVIAKAAAEHADKPLREACAESPVDLGIVRVGFAVKEARTPKPEAWGAVVSRFLERAKPQSLEHLVAMLPGLLAKMKPGEAQLRAVASYLYEGRDQETRERRRRFIFSLLALKPTRQFGILDGEKGEDNGDESE